MKKASQHNPAIPLYGEEGFAAMRKAGQFAARVLDMITPYVVPGVTTGELDKRIHDYIEENGATSATIGYRGYKHASCISHNHVVCHGIPGDKILEDGDIVNIDVTAIIDGWYGDTSRMYWVGDKQSIKAKILTKITYECLMKGIEAVKPGATLGDIGHTIQSHAESNRFSVVRDFCGHGIGEAFHVEPQVVHFGEPGQGVVLEEGMILTIEPMINEGTWKVTILSDGWTAVTKDKKLSAQFEHSIGVTKDGYEIFTLSPKGYTQPPYDVEV